MGFIKLNAQKFTPRAFVINEVNQYISCSHKVFRKSKRLNIRLV